MPDPLCDAPALLTALDSRDSLFAFLRRYLDWQVDPEDTFTYADNEAVGRAAARATLSQILPFASGDPFVIFLVEFEEGFRRGDLREILRGVRRRIREEAAYQSAALDELIFVCTLPDGLRFVRFEEREGRQAKLRVFGFDRETVGETYTLRTVNLPLLRLTTNLLGEPDWSACRKNWEEAWSVEKVTRQFFRDYKRVFEAVRDNHVSGVSGEKQLWTQRLFNRLMFIHFLSKKGWIRFGERTDYLMALYAAAQANGENFYYDRLYWAFFNGLGLVHGADAPAHSIEVLRERRGDVPYLNGGLFEMADSDDIQGAVRVANEAFALIFDELFGCYNFTVAESTPDDADVAVDPEMLGKVFEELVTGRHESGSYYTPRPVVQFMCREALKGYLAAQTSPPNPPQATFALSNGERGNTGNGEIPGTSLSNVERGDGGVRSGGEVSSLDRLVDFHDAGGITNHEAVLDALKRVKVVDPACGSGAYLLGMMQELMALRLAVFNAKQLDAKSTYERKLEIIQNNLYGVDLDMFAVNTARLRLWLSLVVEDGRNPLTDLTVSVALPNLDFKIEPGDSVASPDPSAVPVQVDTRTELIRQFEMAKRQYGDVHWRGDRPALKQTISDLRGEIAQITSGGGAAFDWRVDFGEVTGETSPPLPPSPMWRGGSTGNGGISRPPLSTLERGPGGEVSPVRSAGFDIVLANPPYVRGELIKDQKPALKRIYGDRFGGTMDLYCFFYFRAIELLKDGGQLVFITPNKWFRAGYGEKLRATIAQTCRVRSITDFGDLPVFESATAYPMIFIAQKGQGVGLATVVTEPKTLAPPYPDIRAVVEQVGFPLPADAISGSVWNLSRASDRVATMRAGGVTLGEYVKGRIFYGVKTGLNNAFKYKGVERDALIAADPKSAEIIKPLAAGRDIKRWYVDHKDQYLIFTRRGVEIQRYPAIEAHLAQWKAELTPKKKGSEIGRAPGDYKWYELQASPGDTERFERPKIIYQIFQVKPCFSYDTTGVVGNNAVYVMPTNDLFLLGVMNSEAFWLEIARTCSKIQNGYQLMWSYFRNCVIPAATAEEKAEIAALVQVCLDRRGQDVGAEEAAIDARVARLYGV